MTGRFTLRSLNQPISPDAVREYLLAHGWATRVEGPLLICEGPTDDSGRPIIHFLPSDESYDDFPLRLEDLITALSVLENRPAMAVAAEMSRHRKLSPPVANSLAEAIAAELSGSEVQLIPDRDLQSAIEELKPLLASAELAVRQDRTYDLASRQQAALLAVRLMRLVKFSRASQMLVWRVCDRILTEGGLRLLLSPKQVEELCYLASMDDPRMPDAVLEWISTHATDIRNERRNRAADESGRPAQ